MAHTFNTAQRNTTWVLKLCRRWFNKLSHLPYTICADSLMFPAWFFLFETFGILSVQLIRVKIFFFIINNRYKALGSNLFMWPFRVLLTFLFAFFNCDLSIQTRPILLQILILFSFLDHFPFWGHGKGVPTAYGPRYGIFLNNLGVGTLLNGTHNMFPLLSILGIELRTLCFSAATDWATNARFASI